VIPSRASQNPPVTDFLLLLPVLLFSVVAHEYAHAWTAYRQGDPTAYMLGRLTLNPVPHIDPFMSVLVPVGLWVLSHGTFTFGAARPVPINPRNFRNYRRGDLIVSSAGIVANLLLAGACAVLFVATGVAGSALGPGTGMLGLLQRMMITGIWLNFLLAFFNLVPLPPLDGSHLFYHLLPPALGARYRAMGRYGFLLLFATFMIPGLSVIWNVLLWPVVFASRLTFSAVGGFALPGVLR
jgi:Zn-dependent protease